MDFNVCHRSINGFYIFTKLLGIVISQAKVVGYCNISSKFNFQVAWLKVKVTVPILRKIKLCHHSCLCIY